MNQKPLPLTVKRGLHQKSRLKLLRWYRKGNAFFDTPSELRKPQWEEEAEKSVCVALVLGLPSYSMDSLNSECVVQKAPMENHRLLQSLQNQGVLYLLILKSGILEKMKIRRFYIKFVLNSF